MCAEKQGKARLPHPSSSGVSNSHPTPPPVEIGRVYKWHDTDTNGVLEPLAGPGHQSLRFLIWGEGRRRVQGHLWVADVQQTHVDIQWIPIIH